MMELNKTINWKPESTGTGRFGKWLENLNDWNLRAVHVIGVLHYLSGVQKIIRMNCVSSQ